MILYRIYYYNFINKFIILSVIKKCLSLNLIIINYQRSFINAEVAFFLIFLLTYTAFYFSSYSRRSLSILKFLKVEAIGGIVFLESILNLFSMLLIIRLYFLVDYF